MASSRAGDGRRSDADRPAGGDHAKDDLAVGGDRHLCRQRGERAGRHAGKPEHRWISFSVTKSITSTLVGAALQDGRIKSLDDLVTHYIPRLAGSAYDGVTIRQLLTMSSGVRWSEDYSDPNSDVARAGTSP